GVVAAPIDLREEGSLVIERGEFVGDEMRVACSFDALFTSVVAGQRLLLDDGKIELEVTAVEPGRLTTRVIAGGRLDSNKGINVPATEPRAPALHPTGH